ncbi:MAG: hypothetical protein OXF02_06095 [Simkaniaceae bacterium]|nr:hypothetical protein [Simkaniaceae bacterium]
MTTPSGRSPFCLFIALGLVLIAGAGLSCTYVIKDRFKQLRALYRGGFPAVRPSDSMMLPLKLWNVPFGEETGTVLDVKTVRLRGVPAPYNSSLIDDGENFLLFFRHDELLGNSAHSLRSRIGVAELDANFDQTEKPVEWVDLSSDRNEDPRIFRAGRALHLLYNSSESPDEKTGLRHMRIARLDEGYVRVDGEAPCRFDGQKTEKNWTPFVVTRPSGEEIHIKYYLFPNQNLKITDPLTGSMEKTSFERGSPRPFSPGWGWGILRGGTPALKVDDKRYLAFFHSRFRCADDSVWYVMGAYTFEVDPPYRITGISHYPILFKGIYSSPPLNTAPTHLRNMFPAGFVLGKKGGREVIWLSVGENDAATKILTLDKEKVLAGLKEVRHVD